LLLKIAFRSSARINSAASSLDFNSGNFFDNWITALAELGEGDFVGEHALLEAPRRSATVRAKTYVTLIKVNNYQAICGSLDYAVFGHGRDVRRASGTY
jgi:hypothetical protein